MGFRIQRHKPHLKHTEPAVTGLDRRPRALALSPRLPLSGAPLPRRRLIIVLGGFHLPRRGSCPSSCLPCYPSEHTLSSSWLKLLCLQGPAQNPPPPGSPPSPRPPRPSPGSPSAAVHAVWVLCHSSESCRRTPGSKLLKLLPTV